MRRLITVIACAVLSVTAGAETFGVRFEDGYAELRSGDPDAALAAFQELLTDTPNSELVQYSIAAALYEKGLKDLGEATSEEALESLYKARDGFDSLRNSRDPFLRENAPFNAANSTAQVARHMDPKEQYNERVQALQDAIQSYETILRMQPKHDGAKTNLNHARYLLKTMMQEAPPEQDQADDSGGDEGEEGENQQENQEGEEGEEDQEGEGEQEPQDGEQDPSEDENPGGDPQDSASDGNPLEDQNIEAILQSLEDKNKEEQKNLRKAKGPPKVRGGKWW